MPAAAPSESRCRLEKSARAPAVYRPRRPAASVLHRVVREHLETFLAWARHSDPDGDVHPVTPATERAFRDYLRCGIAAHGFARVRCAACRHEYLVPFSCKVRDLCPGCAARRMVETAAHLVDLVLPRVPYRQWVLSAPKRIRWHLARKPAVVDGLLRVFLRAVETTLRRTSPDAPPEARFGAVAFVHRFGSFLNPHVHYHVVITDGVFAPDPDDERNAVFYPALDLDAAAITRVRDQVRRRGLRWLTRHGHLDSAAAGEMLAWQHGGGWSLDAAVRVPAWDRHGLEQVVRYCARPALAAERLGRLSDDLLSYRLRRPTPDGRRELLLRPLELLQRLAELLAPPRKHRHRYHGVLAPHAKLRAAVITSAGPAGTLAQDLAAARQAMGLTDKTARRPASRSWALLVARIHGSRPLQCPRCGQPLRILAFILEREVIVKILAHLGEPTDPPPLTPARGPPQGEFGFEQNPPVEFNQDAGQPAWPDLDQTAGLVEGE